jgi:hypothetical protein
MSEHPDGLILASISWTPSPTGRTTVLAEPVTDHMVVHPTALDDEGTGHYKFSGAWTVTHQPSGLTVCPHESLSTIGAARRWARIVEDFPGLDLEANNKDAVLANADEAALVDRWIEFRRFLTASDRRFAS